MKKFWEVKQSSVAGVAEIFIYGPIVSFKWDDEDTTASSFQKDLKALGDVDSINLHINSPGGSVFEGIAIGNMLKHHKAHVTAYVDALAASIASVIVASCDEVIMPENSMLMIHNPMLGIFGNANELRKTADDLDKIAESSVITYLSKAGDQLTEEKIKQIMDEETWMSAQEAFEIGLCDSVIVSNQMVAAINEDLFQHYQSVPERLMTVNQSSTADKEIRERLLKEAQQNNALIGAILGGI
ncbi:Clp protease ClpP [Marinilactibacillus sp. 15R]|uniref:head maturation protease, ClpP-related n=1 Tax=Marinilactibacillus sp. 15R TaxID=1911586 RepID=UPI0009097377|nr:head maturation protease, ClpP-related [Marinilactibacillus sp. 15R]API89427.1 Clp protease ClpP [Marinilactibacillus sp. 15R]